MQTTEQKQSLFDRHPVSMTLVILAFVLGTVTAIAFVLTTDASSADAAPKTADTRTLDKILIEKQLAPYKKREQLAVANPEPSAPISHAKILGLTPKEQTDLEEILALRKELRELEDHDSDPEQPSPNVDPFGNPLNENGEMVGGDPCAGYELPDFTTDEWLEYCQIFDMPEDRCPDFLELEAMSGNISVHPDFEKYKLPPKCRI